MMMMMMMMIMMMKQKKQCKQTRYLLSLIRVTKILSPSVVIMMIYLSWRKVRNIVFKSYFLSMDLFRAGLNLANLS